MFKLQRILQVLLMTVMLGTGLVAAPSTASAAACTCPDGSTGEVCQTEDLALNPPDGWYYCQYTPLRVVWPDGHPQYFVIGGGNHVYDSFRRSNGTWSSWRNLGGVAQSRVHVEAFGRGSDGHTILVIRVLGADTNGNGTRDWWCKPWHAINGWSGWRPC